MKEITVSQIYLGCIVNFLLLVLDHWLMTKFFGVDSQMAWIIAMFLMAIFECDEFMHLHWDKRGDSRV